MELLVLVFFSCIAFLLFYFYLPITDTSAIKGLTFIIQWCHSIFPHIYCLFWGEGDDAFVPQVVKVNELSFKKIFKPMIIPYIWKSWVNLATLFDSLLPMLEWVNPYKRKCSLGMLNFFKILYIHIYSTEPSWYFYILNVSNEKLKQQETHS